jgi:hypothetical protein
VAGLHNWPVPSRGLLAISIQEGNCVHMSDAPGLAHTERRQAQRVALRNVGENKRIYKWLWLDGSGKPGAS